MSDNGRRGLTGNHDFDTGYKFGVLNGIVFGLMLGVAVALAAMLLTLMLAGPSDV